MRTCLAAFAFALALSATAAAEGPLQRACAPDLGDPREAGRVCVALDPTDSAVYAHSLCRALAETADDAGLPRGFFTRLIWTESRFDPTAVSPANAQGIAQFIPSTARIRGLSDPFNPAEALRESARYLAELRAMFGNLGLAAVAYNAGEGRADRVLRRGAGAPFETRNYVMQITGLTVEDWADGRPRPDLDYGLRDVPEGAPAGYTEGDGFHAACVALVETRRIRRFEPPAGEWRPWGVQIAVHVRPAVARRMFAQAQARIPALAGETPMVVRDRNRSFGPRARTAYRVGRDSRADALRLCRRVRSQGGSCVVVRN